MSEKQSGQNVKVIINRIISDLEHLGTEINKLLGEIYASVAPFGIGNKNGKKIKMRPPTNGLKYPEVRKMIIDLREQFDTVIQIEGAIKKKWPRNPEKHVSKSSIHRFITKAKQKKLNYSYFKISD